MGGLGLRDQVTGQHRTDLWTLHFLEAVFGDPSVMSKSHKARADPPHFLPLNPEGKAGGSKHVRKSFNTPPSKAGA